MLQGNDLPAQAGMSSGAPVSAYAAVLQSPLSAKEHRIFTPVASISAWPFRAFEYTHE